MLPANCALHLELDARGLAHGFDVLPGGHKWPYWSTAVDRSLRFFGDLAGHGP